MEIDGFLVEERIVIPNGGEQEKIFACSSPEGDSLFWRHSLEEAKETLSEGLVLAIVRTYPKKSAIYDDGTPNNTIRTAMWHPQNHRIISKALRLRTWEEADLERRRIMCLDGNLSPVGPFPPKIMEEYLNRFFPLPRGRFSQEIRDEVYSLFDGHCAYCGEEIPKSKMQVDHIESHYMHLGKDELANYYPSCALCNRVKSYRTMEEFRERIRTMGHWYRSDPPWDHRDNDAAKIAEKYKLKEEDHEIEFYFERVNSEIDKGEGEH